MLWTIGVATGRNSSINDPSKSSISTTIVPLPGTSRMLGRSRPPPAMTHLKLPSVAPSNTLPIALVGFINPDIVIYQNYQGPGSYGAADLAGNLGGFQIVVVHDRFEATDKTMAT